MVVKTDGTKWACMSCLKGHRVSGCTHTDRELVLVPKKGRPVTQCQHCRQERKKRSAHVKCDCGETDKPHHPREKCIHLRAEEERLKAGLHSDTHPQEHDIAHLAAVAEEQGCCCGHGGKCTCSLLKKETCRDSEDDGLKPCGPAVKPRLDATRSDGHITVFHNGHHKPVHRKNHAAHECGMPYKMPLPRAHTADQTVAHTARRSVDNLPADSNVPQQQTQFMQGPLFFNTERRQSGSEHPSPRLNPAHPSTIDLNSLALVNTNQSLQSATSGTYAFPPLDIFTGMPDSSYDPWSSLPSADSTGMPNNNPFGVWPTNEHTNLAQPALTTASSGTQSEIDEVPSVDETYGFGMPSIQEDPHFNPIGLPATNSFQTNRRSLPPNFFSESGVLIPTENEWQPSSDLPGINAVKPKPFEGPASSVLGNVWQTGITHTTSLPQRSAHNPPPGGRPPSHSVGPANAPNDDLMAQLFPDIDVNGSLFTSDSPSDLGKAFNMTSTSATMEFGPLDTDVSFSAAHPWTDGSLSVPSDDAFNPTYDLDQDFSASTFAEGWSR